MVQHEQDGLALQRQFDNGVEQDEDGFYHADDDDEVSILMLGDPNCGKTSLIYTLVNDSFEPNVPAKMADIDISADITPYNVPLHIVDYSEREQDHQELENAITNSNVICIVYDTTNPDALDRIVQFWLPLIHKCNSNNPISSFANEKKRTNHKPLILVASKIDLIEDDDSFLQTVTGILQEYVDIEAHIETSALNQRNVVELYALAQKAVIFPISLLSEGVGTLTQKCSNALSKIFDACDTDGDGLLNDLEMAMFHIECFGAPLQTGALKDLKSVIEQSIMGGLSNDSITKAGFLFIHSLSIDMGRHEFTWQVLRKFNYNNQLDLKQLNPEKEQVDEGDLIDNSSLRDSQSHCSRTNSDRRNLLNSSSEYDTLEAEDSDSSDSLAKNHHFADGTWLREHSNLIKAGIGLTLATLMMLALKFLHSNNNKSFA